MIRIGNLSDLNIIIDYKVRMFRDAGVEDKLHNNCKSIIKSKYSELYKENKAIHYLVEEDNEIIAIAGAFLKEDIPYCFYKTGQYGFIGDMYTVPKHRNKGYASKLLIEVKDWLKDKGVSEIRLLASDDGRSIYEKSGFKINTAEMILYLE